MECEIFHLLWVFQSDAAEIQKFYIGNGSKKSNIVPIRQFMQRIHQLNGYLDQLPCLFYSKCTTKLTKVMKPFNDVDLASHILRMVPRNWQDQYKLTGASVPQSVHKLLEVLEHVEKAFPTKKECTGPKASAKGGSSSKKKMVAFRDRIPKKRRMDTKHGTLCKQHGVAHNTHNTGECHKYEKDGTPNGHSQGRGCSTIHTVEMHQASRTIATCCGLQNCEA
jgi:hypothetical protein